MKLGVGGLGLDDKLAMPEGEGLHSLVREVVVELGVHNLALVAEVVELHSLAQAEEGLHTLALVVHNLALVVVEEHSLVQEVHNLVREDHSLVRVGHSLVQEDHN